MRATHIHVNSGTRLEFVEYTGQGQMAIFIDVDCPYDARITCPATPKYVIPYSDDRRAQVVENANVKHLKRTWDMCVLNAFYSRKGFHFGGHRGH